MIKALELPDIINQSTCWKAYYLEESKCCLHIPPNPRFLKYFLNKKCFYYIKMF